MARLCSDRIEFSAYRIQLVNWTYFTPAPLKPMYCYMTIIRPAPYHFTLGPAASLGLPVLRSCSRSYNSRSMISAIGKILSSVCQSVRPSVRLSVTLYKARFLKQYHSSHFFINSWTQKINNKKINLQDCFSVFHTDFILPILVNFCPSDLRLT